MKRILRSSVILYSAFCVLYLTSCSPEKKQNATPLFDVKKYFEAQIALLKQANPKVQKLVIQNGQAESRDMQIADWNTELRSFVETDISKPALRNSYNVDSLDANHVVYTAVDSSQAIRTVDLQFNKDTITQITIQRHMGSKLLQSSQTLTWSAGNGYTIEGNQNVVLGKENNYTIKASFLK